MKSIFKKLITKFISVFGFKLIRQQNYDEIISDLVFQNTFRYLKKVNSKNPDKIINYAEYYFSQLGQDIFVLDYFNFKKNGFFVEFGAANGKELSNTYILEKEFGWSGIISEPALSWHQDLHLNRSCNISTKCVWKKSSERIKFSEVKTKELSTLSEFKNSDQHNRKNNKEYFVETISLTDLLSEYNAPKTIDYLSIDTEGSEFEILSNFDFNQYTVKLITVEHNFTSQREKIYKLLTQVGYERVFEELSQFDDWYILKQ